MSGGKYYNPARCAGVEVLPHTGKYASSAIAAQADKQAVSCSYGRRSNKGLNRQGPLDQMPWNSYASWFGDGRCTKSDALAQEQHKPLERRANRTTLNGRRFRRTSAMLCACHTLKRLACSSRQQGTHLLSFSCHMSPEHPILRQILAFRAARASRLQQSCCL